MAHAGLGTEGKPLVLGVELTWLDEWLTHLCAGGSCLVVNLGSGPRLSGERLHIADLPLFDDPTVSLLNVDLFDGPGVDVVSDIIDPVLWESLRTEQRSVFVLSNVLEHVENPTAYAAFVQAHLPCGAHLLATAPHVYPHHPDPIDNGLRLPGDALCKIFDELEPVASATVVGPRYVHLVLGNVGYAAKTIVGGPFLRRTRDRWRHLHRRVEAGCAVLLKPA